MQNLVVVLVLLAIYALAAIAYRRPSRYQRIVWPLMAVSVAASIGINVWNISSDQTELALQPYLADDKIAEAIKAVDAVTVSAGPALLIVVAAPLYLMILLGLPFLVARTKRDGDRSE